MENQSPQSTPNLPAGSPASEATILAELTPKNRLFLMGMLEGKKVFDAYKEAGYDGDSHAAYVLKSRLNKELAAFASVHGVSREDLMLEISKLNNIPLAMPAGGVNINQKLRILALQEKVLSSMKPERPNITAITINRFDAGNSKPTEGQALNQDKVIEADVFPPSAPNKSPTGNQ